jgi:uncharacterized protein
MPWDFILILTFLAVGVPLLGRRRIRQLMAMPHTTKRDRLKLYASTVLSQWCAVAIIFWRCKARGVSIEQLGFAIPHMRLAAFASIGLTTLLIANQIVGIRQLTSDPKKITGIMPKLALRIFPQDTVERLVFVLVVTTVAFCEEMIYRGFVQWIFADWARGAVWVGVVASALLFGLAHLYQGRQGLIATSLLGLTFAVIRAWTGSLLPLIIGHFSADLTIGLLAPRKLSAALNNITI